MTTTITIIQTDSPSSNWPQWPGLYDNDTSGIHHKRAGDGQTSTSSDRQWSNTDDLLNQLIQLLMQFNGNGNEGNTGDGPDSGGAIGRHHGGGGCHHHHCDAPEDGTSGSSGKTHGTSSDSDATDSTQASSRSGKDQPALDGPTTPGKAYTPGKNPKIDRWENDINLAARLTGLDGNLIGGQMWAESRGNPKEWSKNSDGTPDLSLMQIGQRRWEKDVLPTLTQQDKENIKKLTGKDAKDLDMSNPHDNVIAGAFELKSHIIESGGDRNNPMANEKALKKGLEEYVGVGDEAKYARHVMTNYNVLNQHKELDDSQ